MDLNRSRRCWSRLQQLAAARDSKPDYALIPALGHRWYVGSHTSFAMSLLTLEFRDNRPLGNTSHLEKSLEAVPGVQSVEIDPNRGWARVEHDQVDASKLLRAFTQHGYQPRVIESPRAEGR